MILQVSKIAFLFGAGVSVPAGVISTNEITEIVVTGNGLMRHTDSHYYFDKPSYGREVDPNVERVAEFIKRIRREIESFYSHTWPNRITNYEDIYYVINQVNDSISGEYENPAIQPFIEKINPDIKHILDANNDRHEWSFSDLTREALNYISDIVYLVLQKPAENLEHLSFLKDALTNTASIDIFSLNHDLAIEKFFEVNGIGIVDGFGEAIEGIRFWNKDLLETASTSNRLCKLHGSINWFFIQREKGKLDDRTLLIEQAVGLLPLDKYIFDYRSIDSSRFGVGIGNERPLLLIGTFNKILNYTTSIFAYVYNHFFRSLENTSFLIVVGYSFNDKGINSRITEWLNSGTKRLLLIIHPNPQALKASGRPMIRNQWNFWTKTNRLRVIAKKIENTSWDEILTLLN